MIVIINGNYVIWYQILSRPVEMSFPLYNQISHFQLTMEKSMRVPK